MSLKKAMGSFICFFVCFFSYVPIADEIDDIVANATLTNPIIEFMNAWFGLFWSALAILFLALAFFYIIKDM